MVATSRRSPHLYYLLLSLYISLLILPAVTLRWLAVGLPLRDCRLRSRYTPGRLGFFPSTYLLLYALFFFIPHPLSIFVLSSLRLALVLALGLALCKVCLFLFLLFLSFLLLFCLVLYFLVLFCLVFFKPVLLPLHELAQTQEDS